MFPVYLGICIFVLSPGLGMRVDDHNYFALPMTGPLVLEEVGEEDLQLEGFNIHDLDLQVSASDFESELYRQDSYLFHFDLHRVPIIGDGNCLFRAISFSLYETQDHHAQLRHLAIETLQSNLDEFSDYFLVDQGTPIEQIQRLNTYAGQECIYALAKALNINILVTFGGDDTSTEVVTMENSFSLDSNQKTIHIIWIRFGGGHYEAVSESDVHVATNSFNQNQNHHTCINAILLHTKPSEKISRKVNKESFGESTEQQSMPSTFDTHTYAKKESHLDLGKNVEKQNTKTDRKICQHCKLSFKNGFTLKRHQMNCHSEQSKATKTSNRKYPCMSSSCSERFASTDQVVEHAIQAHDANIAIEHLNFSSKKEFLEYKEQEEKASNTRFVMRQCTYSTKKGDKTYILECHRNGYTRPHFKPQQKKRRKKEKHQRSLSAK